MSTRSVCFQLNKECPLLCWCQRDQFVNHTLWRCALLKGIMGIMTLPMYCRVRDRAWKLSLAMTNLHPRILDFSAFFSTIEPVLKDRPIGQKNYGLMMVGLWWQVQLHCTVGLSARKNEVCGPSGQVVFQRSGLKRGYTVLWAMKAALVFKIG